MSQLLNQSFMNRLLESFRLQLLWTKLHEYHFIHAQAYLQDSFLQGNLESDHGVRACVLVTPFAFAGAHFISYSHQQLRRASAVDYHPSGSLPVWYAKYSILIWFKFACLFKEVWGQASSTFKGHLCFLFGKLCSCTSSALLLGYSYFLLIGRALY